MGVPTAEVGYTPAMPRREDHEVQKGHVVALGGGELFSYSNNKCSCRARVDTLVFLMLRPLGLTSYLLTNVIIKTRKKIFD